MKIHIVKKGDTLFKLSQKYQVPLQKLIDTNPQISNPDQLSIGMKVKIPSEAVAVTNYSIIHKHVVKQGDTLWQLSKAWGISLKDMINANPQLKNPNALLDGEVVNIPNVHSQASMNVDTNVHGHSEDHMISNMNENVNEMMISSPDGKVPTGKKYTGPKEELTKPIEPVKHEIPPLPTINEPPTLPNVQAPMKPMFPEIEIYKETTNVYVLPVETKTEPAAVKELPCGCQQEMQMEPSHDLFAQYPPVPAHEVVLPYSHEKIENIAGSNMPNEQMYTSYPGYPGAPSMMSYPCPPFYPVQHSMVNEPNMPFDHTPYPNVTHVYETSEYAAYPGVTGHHHDGSLNYPSGLNPSYYGASQYGAPNMHGGVHDMHGYGVSPYAGTATAPYGMHYVHGATHHDIPQPNQMMPQYAANQSMYAPYGVQDDCGCGSREQSQQFQVQNPFAEGAVEDPSRWLDASGTGAESSAQYIDETMNVEPTINDTLLTESSVQSTSDAPTEVGTEEIKEVIISNTVKHKNSKGSSMASRSKTTKKDRRSKTKTGRHNPWIKN